MKYLKNIIRKLSTVVLVLSLVIQIPATSAQFSDIEESKDNLFTASKLDLELSSTGDYAPVTIIPGETSTRTITFTNAGEIPFAYNQIYVQPSDDSLCSQLNLKVYREDLAVPLIYSGLLKDFNYESGDTLAVGVSRDYIYELSLPTDADETITSLTCGFDIVSYAWQEELGIWGVGFWDVETQDNAIATGIWEVCVDGDKTWAVSVVEAVRPNGEEYIEGARYNEEKILGEPDGDFYSMGSGASITVEMEKPVDDTPGNDLSVHLYLGERDGYNVETGSVYASADGDDFVLVGVLRNDDVEHYLDEEDPNNKYWGVIYFDISHTGLPWFKYVKIVDTPDIEDLDNNSGGFDVDAIDGEYRLCDEPSLPVCNTIFGSKKDETDAGLSDWEIVVHPTTQEVYDSFELPASDYDGVTSKALENGKKYLIEVSGYWTNADGTLIDANYYSTDDWDTHQNYDGDMGVDQKQLDVVIDDLDVYWNGYSSTHLYKYIIDGDDSTHNIRIFETDENDNDNNEYVGNTGALQVRIFDITNQIVKTDATGVYSRFVCGGPYQVMEIQQNGWEQVSPAGPNYYYVDLNSVNLLGYDFVNKKLSGKIVINEVYYDVDSTHGQEQTQSRSDEWVELYNGTALPINLKNWSIADNNGEGIISNRNVYIPSGGYAVLAKSANTWTYWPSIPSSAVLIEIGNISNFALANDGDRVILKDNTGAEIDAVNYGDDAYAFTPSVSDVAEGHSISRKPAGYDTDQASDWIDTFAGSTPPGPNPGTNPHNPDGSLVEGVGTDIEKDIDIDKDTDTDTEIDTDKDTDKDKDTDIDTDATDNPDVKPEETVDNPVVTDATDTDIDTDIDIENVTNTSTSVEETVVIEVPVKLNTES